MAVIIDRRDSGSDRSIVNRQRFLQRSQRAIKKSIDKNITDRRGITEILNGDVVRVPVKDIVEPSFDHSGTKGIHDYIRNGNDQYEKHDLIKKDRQSDGSSSGASNEDGEMEDYFRFTVTKEEYLNIFFEDLELPDLLKKQFLDFEDTKPKRSGFTKSGSAANKNVQQSYKKSLGRRIALHRPSDTEIKELEEKLAELEASLGPGEDMPAVYYEMTVLCDRIRELKAKQRRIPFFDNMDIRFNNQVPQPQPATAAVMFCLMDVSGSMSDMRKNLAKRFFMLLYFFLSKTYEKIDVVFIRHTTVAEEVDEETFFYDTQTGGTVVSTALQKMIEIVQQRYPKNQWNIYAAQASDGDNFGYDNEHCVQMMNNTVLDMVQYFAYIEVDEDAQVMTEDEMKESGTLVGHYSRVGNPKLASRHVTSINQIWTVFRELFRKRTEGKRN